MNNTPTLQGILSRFTADVEHHHRITPAQYKVIRHLSVCRTKALGGQYLQCDTCDFDQHRYHSCRNRHCPKCQQKATRQWCDTQQEKLLPVPYYHLVFTLAHELNPSVQRHDNVVYRCLFESVWHTLKTFAADKKRLNGELGMTAIYIPGDKTSADMYICTVWCPVALYPWPRHQPINSKNGIRQKATTCFPSERYHAIFGAKWSAPCDRQRPKKHCLA